MVSQMDAQRILTHLFPAGKMAEKGITLYFVGCEPSVLPYKDFYTGLAFITGGQYVPLQNPEALSKVSWKNYQEFSVVHCYPSSTTF